MSAVYRIKSRDYFSRELLLEIQKRLDLPAIHNGKEQTKKDL